jgi:hypothetical protein
VPRRAALHKQPGREAAREARGSTRLPQFAGSAERHASFFLGSLARQGGSREEPKRPGTAAAITTATESSGANYFLPTRRGLLLTMKIEALPMGRK